MQPREAKQVRSQARARVAHAASDVVHAVTDVANATTEVTQATVQMLKKGSPQVTTAPSQDFPAVPAISDEAAERYENAVSLLGTLIAECSARAEHASDTERDDLLTLRSDAVRRREELDPEDPGSLTEAVTYGKQALDQLRQ
ncbi:hypothetical protein JL475_20715 [Streptomyces sp. M2CJ-2]|uniref:hypothetical protein n=1 Tax=Streptomyces sp. M2CJ-2 TaxID=2803948 RepID=UPI0019262A6F|nr:hypothetical protein [Streptomyces sp. M2CJ-2]MBL3668369.1 hypothetical protein [Streptomyces sp. M2CJ-2]